MFFILLLLFVLLLVAVIFAIERRTYGNYMYNDFDDEEEEIITATTTTTTVVQDPEYVGNLKVKMLKSQRRYVIDPVDGKRCYLAPSDDIYEDADGKWWKLVN